MKKLIPFPIAIMVIILASVVVSIVLVVLQYNLEYKDVSQKEKEASFDNKGENYPNITMEMVEVDSALENMISLDEERDRSNIYKSYAHEFEIEYPDNDWETSNLSFSLCKEIPGLYGGYCIQSFVLYLDNDYSGYNWDRDFIEDFSVRGYWEYDYVEGKTDNRIIIDIDKTEKMTTNSGKIGHIGVGHMGIEESGVDKFSEMLQKFVVFPLKSGTKVLVIYTYLFDELEELIEEGTGTKIEIKEEVKIEIEEDFDQALSTFKFIQVKEQCKYGKGKYEIRIYDSEGRVTGLVNGEAKREIPGSSYFSEYYSFPNDISPQSINIFDPKGPYTYEIFGIRKGNYNFSPSSTKEGVAINFKADNIPLLSGHSHKYNIDWEALAKGEKGTSLLIDSNGDGVFEKIIKSDDELTCEEFLEELE